MIKLPPKLKPFWYTPEFQEQTPPVRFQLRPLTQEEVVEVESLYVPNDKSHLPPTIGLAARFRAAMLSIVACDGIIGHDGEPLRWPIGIDVHGKEATELRSMILLAGLRIIYEMDGIEWDTFVKRAAENIDGKQPAETSAEKT